MLTGLLYAVRSSMNEIPLNPTRLLDDPRKRQRCFLCFRTILMENIRATEDFPYAQGLTVYITFSKIQTVKFAFAYHSASALTLVSMLYSYLFV